MKLNNEEVLQCELCFTDTGILYYHIFTKENIHDILFKDDLNLFDTSNYPTDHKYFSNDRSKVVGKFKDECGGQGLSEFVGLSKLVKDKKRPRALKVMSGRNTTITKTM